MLKPPYHRGTPREPVSLKWQAIIVSLLVAASTGAASAILYSQIPPHAVTIWSTLLTAAGAITCLVAFLYDATFYGLVLQVVVFVALLLTELSDDDNVKESLAVAARYSFPIILVVILSISFPTIFSSMTAMVSPLVLASVSVIAVLNYGVAYSLLWKSGNVTLFSTLAGAAGLGVLILLWAWYYNRTHRHMNLMHKKEMGISAGVSLALVLSMQQFPLSPMNPSLLVLLPVLLGSTICTLICVTLSATADVWNAVGSNQFWMLALDMTALCVYSIIPAILLFWRLWIRFGALIFDTIHSAAQMFPGDADVEYEMRSLLLLLAVSTCFGIFYTKSMCPLGCHLLGRIYCSGMHFTKTIAIILDWTDCKLLVSELQRLQVTCHFVVTYDQLKTDTDLLQEAVRAGHVILPYTGERSAHVEYERIWGRPPEWAHGESYPSDVVACTKSGTKIALWSNYVRHTVHKDELDADLHATLGGNVICLEQVPNVIEIVEGITAAGYTVATLSIVMKEHKMELSEEQQE